MPIEANGDRITEICSGCIYPFYTHPGSVIISSNWGAKSHLPDINLLPGKAYFVKSSIKEGAFGKRPMMVFQHMPQDVAKAEMYGLQLMQK
jgi:hypothetical protein